MSVRRVICPECGSGRKKVLKEHNPKTTDLNMNVTLKCENPLCKHEWEGRIMSHRTRRMKKLGRMR